MFVARGFRKRALAFHRRTGENFSVVQFQKSQSSDARSLTFTINLGVFSARLQRELDPIVGLPDVKGVPNELACHLRRRIGPLLPERRDTWWRVGVDSAPSEIASTVMGVLEQTAFPFLDALTTDEALRDFLLSNTPHDRNEELALVILVRDLESCAAARALLDRFRAAAPSNAIWHFSALDRLEKTLDR